MTRSLLIKILCRVSKPKAFSSSPFLQFYIFWFGWMKEKRERIFHYFCNSDIISLSFFVFKKPRKRMRVNAIHFFQCMRLLYSFRIQIHCKRPTEFIDVAFLWEWMGQKKLELLGWCETSITCYSASFFSYWTFSGTPQAFYKSE